MWLLPNLSGGGAERTAVNLTTAFQARGIDCTIGVLRSIEDYEPQVRVESVTPFGVSRPELWPILGRRRLQQLEASRSADATISFTTSANLLNARSRDSAYPRYISIRSTPSRMLFGPTGGVYRRLMQRYYPRAAKVIAISKFVADDALSYLRLDPGCVQTIYNPIPIAGIEHLSRERLPAPWDSELGSRFTIVSTGRLSAEKGHAHLLHVVEAMRRRGRDCRLLLAGKGARQADYADLASALGLRVANASESVEEQKAADVVFLGFVKNPFSFMRQAHVFGFPSAFEGLGQALLEAVASGATIVASDCDSGPREILAPNTDYRIRTHRAEETPCGWLVPPPSTNWRDSDTHTVEQWVEALEHIRQQAPDTKRACSERARDFGIESVTDAWLRMLGW